MAHPYLHHRQEHAEGLATLSREELSGAIVDRGIEEELKESPESTVGEFTEGVEERVEETVEGLREEFGGAVDVIAGEVLAEAKGYAETQREIFDPAFKVKDTEKEGAAAWNEKGGDNSIAVGHEGMKRTKNEAYWVRVVDHEEVHQQEQVAEFNLGSISYPDDPEPLQVNPTLVEWHAITEADQPMSDLSPDYQEHKRRGDALVKYLGSPEPLLKALKTGDMRALQDAINVKILEDMLKRPRTEAVESVEAMVAA